MKLDMVEIFKIVYFAKQKKKNLSQFKSQAGYQVWGCILLQMRPL